jgi:hypothetical protein
LAASRETDSGKGFSFFGGGGCGLVLSGGGSEWEEESEDPSLDEGADEGAAPDWGLAAGFFCGWGAGASGTD